MKRPRYYVTTWCADAQTFTPQIGVRTGPYTMFGLRRALRKLRELGYSADRNDPSVYVCRDGGGSIQKTQSLGWNCRHRGSTTAPS